MGFLKKFFRNVFHENIEPPADSSFERLTQEELETHMGVSRYGSFQLTGAVRPSYDLQVKPVQGFRHDCYRDEQTGTSVPVIMASATQDILFDTFIELLDPLGGVVDVVLETSHHRQRPNHNDLYREHIDQPVLQSVLWDFEEMLTNDGCTGLAVLNPHIPLEVQFDEHKLLIVYGKDLKPFEEILIGRDIYPMDDIKFITEAEHVHSSSEEYFEVFEQLTMRLGMDGDLG